MTEAKLRSLNGKEVRSLYHRELHPTFPPDELKPLRTIQRHMEEGSYSAWGLFQGEVLLGYALLWQMLGSGAFLLDYLGVPQAQRGQGWGSQLIAQLLQQLQGASILVEVEAPDAQIPAKRTLQQRRIRFYRRAGFRSLGFDSLVFGVHYQLLASGPGDPLSLLEQYRALYQGHLPPLVYQKFVQIPWNGPISGSKEELL